jgi:hypothetical protein
VVKSCSNSQFIEKLTQPELFPYDNNGTSLLLKLSFLKLQDHVVVISQIYTCNQSMATNLADPSELRRTMFDSRETSSFTGINRIIWSFCVALC